MLKIAEPTVERLVQYHRLLERLSQEKKQVISSLEIGEALGFKASQVRKDISYFGEIGKRGVGYQVDKLRNHLKHILSTSEKKKICLVGVGRLGEALVSNRAFQCEKIDLVALFDVDPSKVGTIVQGIYVYHIDELEKKISELDISIAVITVPAESAQQVADKLLKTDKIKGILNFAYVSLVVEGDIIVYNVDISIEMEKLLFYIKQNEKKTIKEHLNII